MRDGLVVLGIFLVVFGAAGYLYAQTENFLGITVTIGYPYRDLGLVLIVMGLVAVIVGAATGGEETRPVPIPRVVAPRYCDCGQMLRPTDVFCPRCGKPVQR